MEKIETMEARQIQMDQKLDKILSMLSSTPIPEKKETIGEPLALQPTPRNRLLDFIGEDSNLVPTLRDEKTSGIVQIIHHIAPQSEPNPSVNNANSWPIKWKRGHRPHRVVQALDIVNEFYMNKNIRWPKDPELLESLLTAFLTIARYEGIDIFSPSAMVRSAKYKRIYGHINSNVGSYAKVVQNYVYQ